MAGFGDLFGGIGDLLGGLAEIGGARVAETAFASSLEGGNGRGEYDATATVDRVLAGAKRPPNINDI